jgi:hypothetical protein
MWARAIPFFLCVALSGACRPAVVLPIGPIGAPPAPAERPLWVESRSEVADPLPVAGSRVAYSGVEAQVRRAAFDAVLPWAREHLSGHGGQDGFSLLVEVTFAEARLRGRAVSLSLSLRATLRERAGSQHLGQTTAYCEKQAPGDPAAAAPLFQSCLAELSHQIDLWLGTLSL